MVLWSEGKIEKLISEGKCIQKHLTSNATAEMQMEKIARGFNRLMLQGKARQAVRPISNANKGGLLNIDSLISTGEDEDGNVQWKTTREVLREKHPQGRAPVAEILLPEPEINETHHDPNIFERIAGETVKTAANNAAAFVHPSKVPRWIYVIP